MDMFGYLSAKPEPDTYIKKRDDDLSSYRLRQLIGYLGLIFPFVIVLLAWLRDGVVLSANLDSISAYYYSGAAAIFVGLLVTLGLFLFTYEGYNNQHNFADRWCSNIAAAMAILVAVFPTRAPEHFYILTWWKPYVGVIHFVSAGILFSMFALFSLWLFRKKQQGEEISNEKKWSNRIFLGCGLVIVACIVIAFFEGRNDRPIFLPESVALVAFGVSWLVKGHVHRSVAALSRKLGLLPAKSSVKQPGVSK